jgi:hypothetical protein
MTTAEMLVKLSSGTGSFNPPVIENQSLKREYVSEQTIIYYWFRSIKEG